MLLVIITFCLYLLAGGGQIYSAGYFTGVKRSASVKLACLAIGLLAMGLHAILLHHWIDTGIGQNLTFFNLLSLSTWLLALLIGGMILKNSVELLAILIFFSAALSILCVAIFPSQWIIDVSHDPQTLFHIVLSVLTFGVLAMAGLLALFLACQERVLRYKRNDLFIAKLPPLETMETLLFRVNSWGFGLLTVMLFTSFYFYHAVLWILLTVIAWLIFGILLMGRYWRGWRGQQAIYATLCGVGLLIIIYFGHKFMAGVFS